MRSLALSQAHRRRPPAKLRTRMLMTLVAAILMTSPIAAAADEVSWTVATADNGTGRPNFSFELAPGQKIKDTWVVTNSGTEALNLQLYATDAFTSAAGQLDLLDGNQTATGLGTWVRLTGQASSQLALEPGQSAKLPFEVTVPLGTPPGDYAGGLVSVLTDAADATLVIERRLATRIHLRVPGELKTSVQASSLKVSASPAWNPLSPTQLEWTFELSNDGTSRVIGNNSTSIAGPLGWGTTTKSAKFDEVLPGGTVKQTQTASTWPIGPTTVRIVITPESIDGKPGSPVQLEATLWLVPWGWLISAIVIIALAIGIWLWGRRSRWEWVDPSPS